MKINIQHIACNKRIRFIFLLVLTCSSVSAQQQQSFSQYHLTDYAFNPAIAGTKAYASLQTIYRSQWTGIEGAPQTMMAFVQAPVNTAFGNIGLGALLFKDEAAALKRTGFSLTYAQHFGNIDHTSFSLGITGNAEQYGFNKAMLAKSLDPGDPLLSAPAAKMAFDAGFSFYAYGNNWSAGAFADNLFESRISFYNNSKAKLYRHIYAMGQMEFELDEDRTFTLLPAVLIKAAVAAPVQLDVNLNLIHMDNKWIGVHYRNNATHTVSANAGFLIKDKMVIGYAYDFLPNKQNSFVAGFNNSHEITLGFRFINETNIALRNVRCPIL
jgi:type IX secretion system PorP/SprF family membrane protein